LQALREVIEDMTGQEAPAPPAEPILASYGPVSFSQQATMFANLDSLRITHEDIYSNSALPMEEYGMAYGVILYKCETPTAPA
jgi:hypothetical protein